MVPFFRQEGEPIGRNLETIGPEKGQRGAHLLGGDPSGRVLLPDGGDRQDPGVRTLQVFQSCDLVHEVIVVTREDLIVPVSQLCRDFMLDKVTKVMVGGAERVLSVRIGVQEARRDAALIAIHDGARPLLSREVLEEVLKKAAVTGAAAPAIPMVDTIKRAERGVVVETMDRSSLWAVQTPQVFEASLIRAALEKAVADGETLTDDCAAVERIGMKVSLTRGDRENIKLTTPFDLMVGEAIIRQREGY